MHSGVYPVAISEHYLIFAIRKIGVPRHSPRYVETRNFKKFDATAFLSDVRKNSHWSIINSNSSNVNEPWRKWKYSFLDILYKYAPKKVIKVRKKPAYWLNLEIKKEMFTRDPLKRKATKSGSQND